MKHDKPFKCFQVNGRLVSITPFRDGEKYEMKPHFVVISEIVPFFLRLHKSMVQMSGCAAQWTFGEGGVGT